MNGEDIVGITQGLYKMYYSHELIQDVQIGFRT